MTDTTVSAEVENTTATAETAAPQAVEAPATAEAPKATAADKATEAPKSDDVNSTDLTFADLSLPEDLLQAVTDMGFVHPTAVQAKAIPLLMSGSDVVGVA